MAEYISREELIEALKIEYNRSWCSKLPDVDDDYARGARDEYDDVLEIICGMQAADVQPVAHAEWICHEPEIGLYYSCSKCGHNALQGMYKFCPNCGAKMDGDAE